MIMTINDKIQSLYNKIKPEIIKRLDDFQVLWANSTDIDIFYELCFCLCTPQTKAVNADKAIKVLINDNVLLKGSPSEISFYLKGLVRFHNNKSKYIVNARDFFLKGNGVYIKCYIEPLNPQKTRDWFFCEIKGLGLKEASHFMRNIGLGANLAILDRHILKNLVLLGVLENIPKTLSYKTYIEIENKMKIFADEIKIPMDHLDFLLWYKEAGQVFK